MHVKAPAVLQTKPLASNFASTSPLFLHTKRNYFAGLVEKTADPSAALSWFLRSLHCGRCLRDAESGDRRRGGNRFLRRSGRPCVCFGRDGGEPRFRERETLTTVWAVDHAASDLGRPFVPVRLAGSEPTAGGWEFQTGAFLRGS